jgi:hypothetical protein
VVKECIEGKPWAPTVYTYFEPINEYFEKSHRPTLNAWIGNWRAKGWNPVVLNESHARQHPEYHQLLDQFSKLPSVNTQGYDLQCYLRWLAVAQMGGGWMADYDLFNLGFPPQQPFKKMTSLGGPVVPCLMSGSGSEFLRLARFFAQYVPDEEDVYRDGHGVVQKHTSDQTILARNVDNNLINYFFAVPPELIVDQPPRGLLIHFSFEWTKEFVAAHNIMVDADIAMHRRIMIERFIHDYVQEKHE